MNPSDQIILDLIHALSKSTGVLVGGLVGGILGFLLSLVVLGYGIWKLKKGWPDFEAVSLRGKIRVLIGLLWILTLPSGLTLCGVIQGASMGARIAIEKQSIVENAAVSSFKEIGPPVYSALASLPETSEQFPVDALRDGIENLKEDFYTELQSLIAEKTEGQKLAGSFAAFCLNWLAKAKVEEVAAYGTDVLADLESKDLATPSVDQISASIGSVHLKPLAQDGVKRITRLYLMITLIPTLLFSFVPVLIVNWWSQRKRKSITPTESVSE